MALPRIACVTVSMFPLAARLRSEPELSREAVVIVEGNGSAARVVAASRLARRAGVRAGLTLPQARALIPKLVARPRDGECERAAQEALLEVGERFSPRVEDAGEGVIYLDVDGIDRRFRPGTHRSRDGRPGAEGAISRNSKGAGAIRSEGAISRNSGGAVAMDSGGAVPADSGGAGAGETSEHCLGRTLVGAAEAAGLPARIGIASSKLAARIAAGLPESPAVVPAGEEAAFLAPLPLTSLTPSCGGSPGSPRATGNPGSPGTPGAPGIIEIVATLGRWGVRTIGDFARLPAARVTSRLGSAGRELHATARGIDPRPLMPCQPPLAFHEGMELEWPLVALEPFLFVARAALERLCQRLVASGLACARLEMMLRLEPEGHQPRAIDLPAPTRDVKTLVTLLRLDLEARPPGAPVAGFTLAAHPDRPREAQLSLYGPAALSPDKLAATLARLFALLGPGRVGSPRPVDGHRPELMALVEYDPPPPPLTSPEDRRDPRRTTGRGLLAVRVVRPAVEIEVLTPEPSSLPPLRPGIREPGEPGEPGAGERRAPGASVADLGEEIPGLQPLPSLQEMPEPCLLAPLEIRPIAREDTADRIRVAGRVKVAAGPWGLEDEWWAPNPAGRDYWDVELTTGGLYRIFRDRASGTWHVDGVYD